MLSGCRPTAWEWKRTQTHRLGTLTQCLGNCCDADMQHGIHTSRQAAQPTHLLVLQAAQDGELSVKGDPAV